MTSNERGGSRPSAEAIAHVLVNARSWAPVGTLLTPATRLADVAETLAETWEVLLVGSGIDEFSHFEVERAPETLEDVARAYDLWAASAAAAAARELPAQAPHALSPGFHDELLSLERARARPSIVGAEHAIRDRAGASVAAFWRNPAGDMAVVLHAIGGQHAAAVLARMVHDAMRDPPAASLIERARWPIARAQEVVLGARGPAFVAYGSMVCVATRRDHAAIAHVGDARALWLRGERGEWLTSDHVVGVGPYATALTRALGESERFEIDAHEIALDAGDALLLCSRDVWRTYPANELARLVAVHGREAPRVIVGALTASAPEGTSAAALVMW